MYLQTVSEEASGLRVFETMSDEELLVWLTEIFVAADSDNNGVLDRKEFKELMSELNLNESEAMQVGREKRIERGKEREEGWKERGSQGKREGSDRIFPST